MKHGTAALLLLAAGSLSAFGDELQMKDGQVFSGTVMATDGKTVTLQMKIGAGQAEVPYPLSNIAGITFTNTSEQAALLNGGDVANLPRVQAVWEQRKPYLGIQGSDTGSWGLQQVRLLLAKKTKKAAEEALKICAEVEKGDWSAERRSESLRLRLSALAAAGRAEQAMAEAEQMQDARGEDEAALAAARVQSHLVKADLASAKLAELEKDWPKWPLMPEKRRERTTLLHTALDGFTFAAVFHPELLQPSAEGLWKAAELAERAGYPDEAWKALQEIVNWFPEPFYKSKAEERLRALEKNQPSQKPTKEKKP
jgi:hypothetical protein